MAGGRGAHHSNPATIMVSVARKPQNIQVMRFIVEPPNHVLLDVNPVSTGSLKSP
jgi:hypothetical protein